MCRDRCLLYVFGRDWYLVVSADKVDFLKDSLTIKLLRELRNVRWGIPIGYGTGV